MQLAQKLRAMFVRAWFSVVNDDTAIQTVQTRFKGMSRVSDVVQHVYPYGYRAVPPLDAEALQVAVGGSTADAVALCAFSYDNLPPTGSPAGAVGLYLPGTYKLYLDPETNQLILCGEGDAGRTAADAIAVAGATKAEIDALRATVDALVSAYNGHIHTTTATVGTGNVGVIAATTSTATAPAAVGPIASPHVKLPSEVE